MKSYFDLRNGIGKIKPENLDDLWVLESVLQKGNLLKGRTTRTIEVDRGDVKKKVGRKPVTLKIEIDKIELGEKLRVTGKIVEGPDDVEHGFHSIDVTPGDTVFIEKDWRKWEIDKIRSAAIEIEAVLVLVLDDSEADFFVVKERTSKGAHIDGGTLGKGKGESQKPKFLKEVLEELKRRKEKYFVIAGPGFTKEDIRDEIGKKWKGCEATIFLEQSSRTGSAGLQEVVKRGALDRIVKNSRTLEESRAVEKFLGEVGVNGKAVYGVKETEDAVESGAVEVLLVSDKKIRDFEELMEKTEKLGTKVMIISSEHELGERFLHLGGIGGLLRYRI